MLRAFTTFRIGCFSLLLLIFISACGKKNEPPSLKVPPPSTCIKQIQKDNPGQILVMLFGRNECPGTRKATTILDDYAATKPPGVTILRVDVPLPGEKLATLPEWSHRFDRIADKERSIADQLSFFYYPTLYIFDKDGVLRFQGGCDVHEFPAIVKNILSEKKGDKKKVYSRIMPEIGAPAPTLAAKEINGTSVDLKSISGSKGVLLFFARASCPFSMKELVNLDELAGPLNDNGISTALIIQDEGKDSLSRFEKYKSKMTLIPDTGNYVFNKYAVSVTPYFYLVDTCGTIFAHRSFTKGAVINTVNGYLEQKRIKDSLNSLGAG